MIEAVETAARPGVEAYDGRYVTEAGVAITIGRAGAGLFAQIRGLPPVLFLSEGDGAFYAPESGLTLQFAPPSRGRSPCFILNQPGKDALMALRAARTC